VVITRMMPQREEDGIKNTATQVYLTVDSVWPAQAACMAKADHLRSQHSATNQTLWSVYKQDR